MNQNLSQRTALHKFLPFLCMALAIVLLYSPSIQYDFVHDDYMVITPAVKKGMAGIKEIFTENSANSADQVISFYRPLRQVVLALTIQLWGLSAPALHIVMLLAYFLCSVLVYFFLRREFPTYHRWWALLIVLLFVAHTLHVEVVANIKSLDVLLAFIFGVQGLLVFQAYRSSQRKIYLPILCVLLLASLLCKKDGFLLFLILPLLLFKSEKNTWTGLGRAGFKKFFVVVCAAGLALVLVFKIYKKMVPEDEKIQLSNAITIGNQYYFINSAEEKLATKIWVSSLQIKNLLSPHCLFYNWGYKTVDVKNFSSPELWLCIISIIAALVFILFSARRYYLVGWSSICFLILFLPYTQLFKYGPDTAADRFMFAPSLFFIVWVISSLCAILKIDPSIDSLPALLKKPPFLYLLLAWLVYLSALTIRRLPVWKDNYQLYTSDIAKLPDNAIANYLYCQAVYEKAIANNDLKDHRAELEKHIQKTLLLTPGFVPAHQFYAKYKAALGDTIASIRQLDKIVQYNNGDGRPFFSKAVLLFNAHKWREAEENFLLALEKKYAPTEVIDYLFMMAFESNDYPKARMWVAKLKELDPHSLASPIMEAKLSIAEGRLEKGLQLIDQSLRADPALISNITIYHKYLLNNGHQYEADELLKIMKPYNVGGK